MRTRLLEAGRRPPGIAAGMAGALLLSLTVATLGATPASAADTVTCSPNISLFATDASGQLWTWKGYTNFNSALTTVPKQTWSGPTRNSTPDLAHYPKLWGSGLPNTTIPAWGLSNETGRRGVTLWAAGGPLLVLDQLGGLVNSTVGRNRITADRGGTIFDIQYGSLEQWTYNATAKTWQVYNRTLASGWDVYDLITAEDQGVIYARRADNGTLWRFRVDPGSQRLEAGVQVGTGFGKYKSLFAAGGDTLIGVVSATGKLEGYRWLEEEGTWAAQAVTMQFPTTTNFGGYANIWADPRTCNDSAPPLVPAPVFAPERHAPVAVVERTTVGTNEGGVDFAVVDDIGRLSVTRQATQDGTEFDPATFLPGTAAYSGKPQIWEHPWVAETDLRESVLALQRNGHVQRFIKTGTAWSSQSEHGGRSPYPPAVVRLGTKWVAAFLTDEFGKLYLSDSAWALDNGVTSIRPNLLGWRDVSLPGGNPLAGPVTTVPLTNSTTQAAVVARDTTGAVWGAVYTATPLGVSPVSAWKPLGGTGLTGQPAVVPLPGLEFQVFARTADGALVTQQSTNGDFPGIWKPVGSTPATAVGNPSATIAPDGRIVVFLRATDGSVLGAQQQLQACDGYTWFSALDPNVWGWMAADPTAYIGHRSEGPEWVFVSYTAEFELTIVSKSMAGPPDAPTTCDPGTPAGGAPAAGSRTAAGADGSAAVTADPAITVRQLPPLPRP